MQLTDDEWYASLSLKEQARAILVRKLCDRGPAAVSAFFRELRDDIARNQGEEKAQEFWVELSRVIDQKLLH